MAKISNGTKKWKPIFLILVTVCLLAGCSTKKEQDKREPLIETTQTQTSVTEFDWMQEEWKGFEEAENGKQMSVIEYMPFDWEEPDFTYISSWDEYNCFGGNLYMLRGFNTEEGTRYRLYIVDGDTGEETWQELKKDEVGFGADSLVSVQMVSDREAVFFTLGFADGKISNCRALHVDIVAGKLLYETNLYDFYEKNGFIKTSSVGILLPTVPSFDSGGNSYYCDIEASQIYMIDKEGSGTLLIDYSRDRNLSIGESVLMPDGSIAYVVKDSNERMGKLIWCDAENKTTKQLTALDKIYMDHVIAKDTGIVYYVSNDVLYRWNIEKGHCESVFSFKENNINALQFVLLDVNSKGEVLLYQYAGDDQCSYVLSDEGMDTSQMKNVMITSLTNDSSYLKGCAASYSRKNPGTLITYEEKPEEVEAARSRILAELSAGGGPDMLWVTAEDMHILQEKGVLCDLEELIAEETLDTIFDGLIASGTINGEYVGLVTDAYPKTLFTADTTWKESTWNVLEMLAIMEESTELESVLSYQLGGVPGIRTLLQLMGEDMTGSPFVDLEKGESKFDREEFVRLLELTKEYENKELPGTTENLESGKCLARQEFVWSIGQFSSVMREMGETCHLVGMPSEMGYKGTWCCDYFLVVNVNSPYKDVIKEYLEEVLSLENQRQVEQNSVRRDVIEESMIIADWSGDALYKTAAGSYIVLETKPDGTPYFEEYLEFLDSCGPVPFQVEAIQLILEEEAEIFYNGNQSAEKTAENIDRRVQLYLDERK